MAVAAFFYAFIWPSVKISIKTNTCKAQCGDTKDARCDVLRLV